MWHGAPISAGTVGMKVGRGKIMAMFLVAFRQFQEEVVLLCMVHAYFCVPAREN